MEAYRKAFVYVREEFAGTLRETDYGYSFAYEDSSLEWRNNVPLQSQLTLSW